MQSEYITQILQILQKVTKFSGELSQSCHNELTELLSQLNNASDRREVEMR